MPFPTTTYGRGRAAVAMAMAAYAARSDRLRMQWDARLRHGRKRAGLVGPAQRRQPIDPRCGSASSSTPNLPERLSARRCEHSDIQTPPSIHDTPVSYVVGRGAERHGYKSPYDIRPLPGSGDYEGTMTVEYTGDVDTVGSHAYDQRSQCLQHGPVPIGPGVRIPQAERSQAITTLIGSADHGHCDIPPEGMIIPGRDPHRRQDMPPRTAATPSTPDPSNRYTESHRRTNAQFVSWRATTPMARPWPDHEQAAHGTTSTAGASDRRRERSSAGNTSPART